MKVVQATWGTFHQFELAKELHKRGMLECIFSTFPYARLKREGLPKEKIRTYPWFHGPLMLKWKLGLKNERLDREWVWWADKTFRRFVVKHLPDCDIFVALSGAGLDAGLIAQSRGAKYICDRGSTHIRYAERLLQEEFQRWGQEFGGIDPRPVAKEEAEYSRADAITVPSEFARRSFLEMGISPERIHKIPYGVNLKWFQKVADPPDDRFSVLFVGQVSFRKGIPYLLEAFSRLRHPNKTLKIIGAVQPEMKLFLNGKRYDRVEFLGPVPQIRLRTVMSSSHVMVLPSIEEGLAYVQAQAMACGCPVISSTNTGAEDLFENGKEGFIVPPRDPDAITECLEKLAADPGLRERMSEAALVRVKQLGGWHAYGEAYSGLCKSLAVKPSVQAAS
jgi:starch synthase